MVASPPQTCLPSLDDFLSRSPPLTDCPATKAQDSNLGEHCREGAQPAPTPSSLFLGTLGSFRKTIWEPPSEGTWVRKGQPCRGGLKCGLNLILTSNHS